MARSTAGGEEAITGGEDAIPTGEEAIPTGEETFLESLMDTNLYSMGAYFSDQHPELVEHVIGESEAIEQDGLRGYAQAHGLSVEECFQTLLTGLAVRYYKAVAA
jgi:hypothetical protein